MPSWITLTADEWTALWLSVRVSVIGLVNLGSSKGNKIIQIFGRGVRLKGLKADGKRKSIDHVADYAALVESDSPDDRLRQLETLNIFSLKATYLETFLKALDRELPSFVVERRVQVEAQTLKLGKTREAFAAYAEKLPVFKVGREDTEPRLQAVLQANNRWRWAYFDGAEETTGELSRCVIQLDYRPDALAESHNLAQNLRNSWAGAALAFAAGRICSGAWKRWCAGGRCSCCGRFLAGRAVAGCCRPATCSIASTAWTITGNGRTWVSRTARSCCGRPFPMPSRNCITS